MKSKPIRLTKMVRERNGWGDYYGAATYWHISPEDIQSVEQRPNPVLGSACIVHAFGEEVPVKETWTEIDRLLGISIMVEEPHATV